MHFNLVKKKLKSARRNTYLEYKNKNRLANFPLVLFL